MHKIKTATGNLCERDREDLDTLNDMGAVLQQIFNDEQTLPEGLLALAKLANNISFCDTDGKCVRNKCGNIDRSKQNTVFPGGIEFVQIASLRDADLSQLYDLSESYESALREDLRTIHNKIHFLCTQAESCAQDERLSQSLELPAANPFFSEDKCASTLIQIANFLYLPVLTDELMRLVKELGSKDLDFDKKGDRYYFGRILVAAGEMCHEMLSLSISKHSELFSLLNTIRTRLCHNHTIMQDACRADKKLRFMSILKLFNTILSKVMPNIKNEIKSFKALHEQAIACGDYESALQNILANIDALSDTLLHEQHMPTLAELSDIVEIDFPDQKQIKAAQSSMLTKILDRFVEVVNAVAQINTLLEKKQKHPHLVINHINDITDKKISAIAAHIEQIENGGTEKWRKRITTPLRQYLHKITNTKLARATRTTFNYWVTVLNSRAPASMTLTGLNDDGSNLDEVKARIDDIKTTKGMDEFEKIFTIPSDKSPSKVHDLLRLVQEEIQFLLSTLSSIENDDEAIDEKFAGIFMFCQMKIGQFLRDLHLEKMDKTNPFNAVIAHAPLLGDAIVKTIQSRNKGLAHEVLRFNENSFFKTLIHQTITLEKTIAAILFLKDFAKPSLVVDGQMYLNPFLNIYVSYADA